MTQDILIYEFKNGFFILHRNQDGINTGLFAKLDIDCSNEEMGKSVIGALNKFDVIQSKHFAWEFKELNAQLCSWLGARGINVLNKNSRLVQVIRDGDKLEIMPFDNYNKNPWYGPMTKEMDFKQDYFFTIQSDSSNETIGKFVFDAFKISTYNPERKYVKYKRKE